MPDTGGSRASRREKRPVEVILREMAELAREMADEIEKWERSRRKAVTA